MKMVTELSTIFTRFSPYSYYYPFMRKKDRLFKRKKEDKMGITDALRQAGFKPEANTDGEFEVLKGQYKTKVTALRKEPETDTRGERFYAEFTVVETIDGTFGNGRRFIKSYFLNKKDGTPNVDALKSLVNDFFTAGIILDISSDDALEASFGDAIDKVVFLRGWGWTPDKDVQGNPIAEGERTTRQQFVIKQERLTKPRKAKAGVVPF